MFNCSERTTTFHLSSPSSPTRPAVYRRRGRCTPRLLARATVFMLYYFMYFYVRVPNAYTYTNCLFADRLARVYKASRSNRQEGRDTMVRNEYQNPFFFSFCILRLPLSLSVFPSLGETFYTIVLQTATALLALCYIYYTYTVTECISRVRISGIPWEEQR